MTNVLNCKLNDNYKQAVKKGKTLITHDTNTIWNGYRYDRQIISYQSRACWRRASCCGIDEGKFAPLMYAYTNNRNWHKDFDSVVAWWMSVRARTKKDSRIFFVGLPVKVGVNSGYNVTFYRKLRKLLLSWGCQELVKRPYKNTNSGNYLSVIVGQF